MTTMVDQLRRQAVDSLSIAACDRELEHLRQELADFPNRPRRLAILSSIDRWLDCRLALQGDAPTSAAEDAR